jgi:hypothetical protein
VTTLIKLKITAKNLFFDDGLPVIEKQPRRGFLLFCRIATRMNRTVSVIAWLALPALLLAACAGSQEGESSAGENGPGSQAPATMDLASPVSGTEPAAGPGIGGGIFRLSGLTGLQVHDLAGAIAGTIDALIISPGSGQILYALLAPTFEGAQPGSLVAVPWELLQANTQAGQDQDALVFTRRAEALQEAPTFPAGGSVAVSGPGWDEVVDYWTAAGITLPPAGGNDRSGGMMQMRELDRQAADQDRAALGGVPDLLLDPVNGFITYLMVDTGEKLVPVPYNLVEVDPGSGNFTVRAPAERVRAAPGFVSLEQLPDLAQPEWEAEIRAYWAGQQY